MQKYISPKIEFMQPVDIIAASPTIDGGVAAFSSIVKPKTATPDIVGKSGIFDY